MDRFNIQCLLSGQETQLQLDKKAMPGEGGPCYMITENGNFKGYISHQKNRTYKFLGIPYYSCEDLMVISRHLTNVL